MNFDYKDRIIEEALYTVKNNSTVRQTGKHFCIAKSTVHKDITERLFFIDRCLYFKVRKVLDKNLSERHVRGGEATKNKYLKLKEI